MLVVYGIAFIWIEDRNRRVEPKVTDLACMSYKTAFYIGLFQVLSIIPGTSRSGATILGGIIVGTSRSVADVYKRQPIRRPRLIFLYSSKKVP